MEPAPATGFTEGKKKNPIGPPFNQIVVVINAVGVEEAVTFRDLVALSPRAKEIEKVPKSQLIEQELDDAQQDRTLPEPIGIGNGHNASGDSKHFPYDLGGIGNMVQGAELADGVEAGVGKR